MTPVPFWLRNGRNIKEKEKKEQIMIMVHENKVEKGRNCKK